MVAKFLHAVKVEVLQVFHNALHVAAVLVEEHANMGFTSERKSYKGLDVVSELGIFFVELKRLGFFLETFVAFFMTRIKLVGLLFAALF
jgi:hypothetical protein